jgi:hypothetical protein
MACGAGTTLPFGLIEIFIPNGRVVSVSSVG